MTIKMKFVILLTVALVAFVLNDVDSTPKYGHHSLGWGQCGRSKGCHLKTRRYRNHKHVPFGYRGKRSLENPTFDISQSRQKRALHIPAYIAAHVGAKLVRKAFRRRRKSGKTRRLRKALRRIG